MPKHKPQQKPLLEKYIFVPNRANLSLRQSIQVNLQIALENNYRLKVKVVEVLEEGYQKPEILGPIIYETLNEQVLICSDIVVISPTSLDIQNVKVINKPLSSESDALMVVIRNGLSRANVRFSSRKSLVTSSLLYFSGFKRSFQSSD